MGQVACPILFNLFTRKNCNYCKWINITEQEQHKCIKYSHLNNHACVLYGRQLYHVHPDYPNDDYIAPCVECDDDGNKHFNEIERSLNET